MAKLTDQPSCVFNICQYLNKFYRPIASVECSKNKIIKKVI